MMERVILAFALVFLVTITAGAQSGRPRVTPFFHTFAGAGPAFYVECANDSGMPLSSGDGRWAFSASSVRLDGKTLPERGSIGPGLTTEIPAGDTWRGIIVLRQVGEGYLSGVRFGAHLRTSLVVPLSEGRHTLSVRCGEAWSDDVPFFWEAEPEQAAK
jgi:hypothetical protein